MATTTLHRIASQNTQSMSRPEADHMYMWTLYLEHLAFSDFLPKVGVSQILCKHALNNDKHIRPLKWIQKNRWEWIIKINSMIISTPFQTCSKLQQSIPLSKGLKVNLHFTFPLLLPFDLTCKWCSRALTILWTTVIGKQVSVKRTYNYLSITSRLLCFHSLVYNDFTCHLQKIIDSKCVFLTRSTKVSCVSH